MQKLSLAIKTFNDKVKIMNQTGSKQLIMSVEEARNLHSDVFNLLANIAEMQSVNTESTQNSNVTLDGGGF
jgi:hypothetical protein